MFVADCVERVLPVLEAGDKSDSTPRKAIAAARAFARATITDNELKGHISQQWLRRLAGFRNDPITFAYAAVFNLCARSDPESLIWSLFDAACALGGRALHLWEPERQWQTERLFDYVEGQAA